MRGRRHLNLAPPGSIELLRQGIERAGVELFAAYGVQLAVERLDRQVVDTEEATLFAIIGFAGNQVSGFVVLQVCPQVLQISNATPCPAGDWMAELGNQFLGRLKNRLMREGVMIQRVPPATMIGRAASMFCPGSSPTLTLTSTYGSVLMWVRSESAATAESDLDASEEAVMAEGAMILF